MAKFKVGDKVILKSSIIPNLAYNKLVISNAILHDFSEVNYGIIKTYGEMDSIYEVCLKNLKYSWWIGEDALELYQSSIPEYKIGDKVTIFLNTVSQIIGTIADMVGGTRYFIEFEDHNKRCQDLRQFFDGFNELATSYGAISGFNKTQFPVFININNLLNFIEALNKISLQKEKEIKTSSLTINNYENEIRFQKPKASFTRGHVPTGHSICGRQHKITVVVGHLSNQAISC